MTPGSRRTFLVIERFRNGDPRPVYARFAAHGRLAPDDVEYVASWVTLDLQRCYQVMTAPDRARLDEWIARWADLVDFEVHEVMTSADARVAVDRLAGPAGSQDRG